jgi:uncharacterized protein YcgI (DUF1989 family)
MRSRNSGCRRITSTTPYIFMTTGLGDDRFFYLDHDAEQGDYVELFAELDRIAAISACPGASSGPQKRPPGIEIYRSLIRALGEG